MQREFSGFEERLDRIDDRLERLEKFVGSLVVSAGAVQNQLYTIQKKLGID